MKISRNERRKASFVGEYRALCKKYGAMVIHDIREGAYSPHVLARAPESMIDAVCEEILMEPVFAVEMLDDG